MKDIFDKLISRLETAKERITETEDKSIEVPQTETEEKKRVGKKKKKIEQSIQYCGTISNSVTIMYLGSTNP